MPRQDVVSDMSQQHIQPVFTVLDHYRLDLEKTCKMGSLAMCSAQGFCIVNVECPGKWCSLCVTAKKQATDAVRRGPGAGVRPHEWMDSCAACISQEFLLLSASNSPSARRCGHMVVHSYCIWTKRGCAHMHRTHDLNGSMLQQWHSERCLMENMVRLSVPLLSCCWCCSFI